MKINAKHNVFPCVSYSWNKIWSLRLKLQLKEIGVWSLYVWNISMFCLWLNWLINIDLTN